MARDGGLRRKLPLPPRAVRRGPVRRQDKMGVPPVRVYLDRLAQALDSANYPSETNIGETDEKMPLEEKRIARAEPHCFLDMGPGLLRPSEQELHHADIGVCYGETAVQVDGDVELAQRTFRRAHRKQDGPIGH